ncbi:TraB/GumN family protein [Erythrobacter dokdonensis]|uniref:GumN family protein n=1 Tax=Erythrobacter dokdonensis DSW-74 TaxID=1300349 RepID=A0A1A7BIG8_9SPHN|nr:TraB/GumN family protein [Erythrobacter dokdonensis]OBV11000.1 GumN family protein [Erythrobacter dokdonensis DSW-74]
MKKSALMLGLAALAATPLAAQDNAPSENSIVVTAQRSGAPMWVIDTPSGTIILVGEIRAIPETTPWQPDRLREATAEADRVILGARPKVSPGDVLRLMFSGSKFTKLPDKTVASDYLPPREWARLQAIGEANKDDYARQSFLLTAFQMLRKGLRFNRDTTDDASDVVRKAADKAKVPTTRAATLRGEDVLDTLAEAPPSAHVPCMIAAMDAVEAGPEIVEQRGADWRRYAIPAVMANPLEVALGQCWPWADDLLGSELRGIWVDRISEASAATGTTLAVVPLRVLAEDGGVLDQLDARGFDIAGPAWK